MNLILVADEPPPAGLSGGRYPAPAWAILTIAGVVIAGAVAFLVIRSRRKAKGPR